MVTFEMIPKQLKKPVSDLMIKANFNVNPNEREKFSAAIMSRDTLIHMGFPNLNETNDQT